MGIPTAVPTIVLDIDAIRDILPHRYPFLLVDRIVEMDTDRIVGIKNVTANEPFFEGHFPEFPVMPGVLMVEAMAQVGGVLVLSKMEDRKSKLVLLAGVDGAKFRRPVRPGDQLRIEVKVLRQKSTMVKVAGTCTVDGALAAEAEILCVVTDRK
jgi:3-hydroxyacyl-[acyl-carrier-protein] dehydratase